MMVCSFHVSAQSEYIGTYTPYSLFGIGDMSIQGTAINSGMGGVGIGIRDNRYINVLNPASITQRDTLSFMLDFGAIQRNVYGNDGSSKFAYNTAGLHHLALTFPIYKKSALILGVSPYSDVGYRFDKAETDLDLIDKFGYITYNKHGKGSVSQAYVGAAMNFFKHFSVGAQFVYYFGAINRYSNVYFNTDESCRSLITDRKDRIKGASGNFGLQYFQDFRNGYNLTLGFTYKIATNLSVANTRQAFSNSDIAPTDTLYYNTVASHARLPHEFGGGLSFGKVEKWKIAVDYRRQQWKGDEFQTYQGIDFATRPAQSVKLGFEITPNKYDLRSYMKRWTYRVGAYYDQSYMSLNGVGINSSGVTVGFSAPVFKGNNAINFSIDVGRRGTLQNSMVRETYLIFNLSLSLYDVWFLKKMYD